MRLRKIVSIIFIFLCIFSFLPSSDIVFASTTLNNIQDIIPTTYPNATQIEHQISFELPISGTPVATNDYIIIKMPNYLNFNISQLNMSGSFVYGPNGDGSAGNLHYTFSGTTITLTNISIVGGATVNINGIVAQNPQTITAEAEQLSISTDPGGTQIKYASTIQPSDASYQSTASATFTPPTATIVLNGYTSPSEFIQISEGSSVIGTATPDGTGVFSSTISGLQPGLHTLILYGIDGNNLVTANTSIVLYAPIYQTTTYSNIVLSPIVSLSATQVHQSDTLTISGETIPNSTVTISINSPLIQFSVTSDNNGNFSYLDNQINAMTPGQYLVSATVDTQSSLESVSSIAVAFTVLSNNPSGGGGPQPSCNISHGDLNCDGVVDIFDFSILLYNWGTNNAVADINGDGSVDLFDFSIMMYYFSA